ncbi:metallophosphoesterase family protein [Sorangium sp. So ce381]|uniref:metallophosphoesterase family protein n=1 Tax=Sorangium sp. So ce381 TaxID=3133307 RepID=UPI003F5C0803
MRLLCVSDIHGHADALAAVLATAERRGYTQLLVAGDLCFPGPKPLETWRRLTQAKAVCVQGVSDRALATLDLDKVRARSEHERARLDRLSQTRTELGELILARLARLAPTYRLPLEDGGELVLVHGSPADPLEPISHDMTDEEVLSLLGDDPADVVICGGSHVPFDRMVGGVRIINVGSVGEAPCSLRSDVRGAVDHVRVGARAPGELGELVRSGSVTAYGAMHADATFIEIRAGELWVEQVVVPLGRAA